MSEYKGTLKQSWLDAEAASGGRFILQGPKDNMIAQYNGLIEALLPHMPAPSPNVETQDGSVGKAKYRTYKPKGASGPLPTCVWMHGGGYLLGNVDGDDLICRAVSEYTQSAVVSVEYRLTTTDPWPAQLDDSFEVYKWAAANASSFGGDATRMYTAGVSAGGGLSFGVALRALKDPNLKSGLKGVVALCPVTVHYDNVPSKYASNFTSYQEAAKGSPIIDKESMVCFYQEAKIDPKDDEAFPLLNAGLKDLPPVYIVNAGADPLRDDTTAMVAALKEVSVPVKNDFYPELPHVFWVSPGLPDGQEFMGKLFQGIEWVKGQM